MQNILVPNAASWFDRSVAGHASAAATWHHPCAQQGHVDHQFVAILNACRGSGGLARAQEVVALLRRHGVADGPTLANWIDGREVIGFEWQSQTWLPLFQFNRFDMTRQPELDQVFAQLNPVYNRWQLASWFARPNPWLADRMPADTLELDPAAVLQAARAERLVDTS